MKLSIAFLQILPTGNLNENLEKGIKACRKAKEKGADIAELDVDMLRDYRKREVWGRRNRRPELYGIISDTNFSGE